MSEPLSVKLEIYEGPLDLLLELIKKNEMDITNIPMAEVTRQYLDYLHQMKQMNLEIAGEFLVMAATLVLIKSKMLLPADEELQDGEEGGIDPRAELVQKLMEYQAYKAAAKELGEKEEERSKVFTRQLSDYYFKDLEPEDVGIDSFSSNLFDLMQAFAKVVRKFGKDSFHEVFEEIISIDQKIDHLKQLLDARRKVQFSELFTEQSTLNELIVTFLGMLELTKQNFMTVTQSELFDDITLEKTESNAFEPVN